MFKLRSIWCSLVLRLARSLRRWTMLSTVNHMHARTRKKEWSAHTHRTHTNTHHTPTHLPTPTPDPPHTHTSTRAVHMNKPKIHNTYITKGCGSEAFEVRGVWVDSDRQTGRQTVRWTNRDCEPSDWDWETGREGGREGEIEVRGAFRYRYVFS